MTSLVYFLTDGDNKQIKIGYTTRYIGIRIAELKTGNPRRPFKILGVQYTVDENSAKILEKKLHDKFVKYHYADEWFEKCLDIDNYIKENCVLDIDFYNYSCNEVNYENVSKFLNDSSVVLKDKDNLNKNIANLFSDRKNEDLIKFVNEKIVPSINNNKTKIVIYAPPKSGKRKMVQICTCLLPNKIHVLITGQNQTSMTMQQDEHNKFNIKYIIATTTSKEMNKKFEVLKKEFIKDAKQDIIIHFDESDYGAASDTLSNNSIKNKLEQINEICKKYKDKKITIICYSATSEEAIFGNTCDDIYMYLPDQSIYLGPNYYSNNAIKSEPFFDDEYNLTIQGKECLNLLNGNKNFGVLRLSGAFPNKEKQKNIENICAKYNIDVEFIDSKNKEIFLWEYKNSKKNKFGTWYSYTNKTLLIINQMCSRGTEVGFHPDIAFWHEYSSDNSMYATISQRIGRCFYYKTYYNKLFNKDYANNFTDTKSTLQLYCNLDVLTTLNKLYCKTVCDSLNNTNIDFEEKQNLIQEIFKDIENVNTRIKDEYANKHILLVVNDKNDFNYNSFYTELASKDISTKRFVDYNSNSKPGGVARIYNIDMLDDKKNITHKRILNLVFKHNSAFQKLGSTAGGSQYAYIIKDDVVNDIQAISLKMNYIELDSKTILDLCDKDDAGFDLIFNNKKISNNPLDVANKLVLKIKIPQSLLFSKKESSDSYHKQMGL